MPLFTENSSKATDAEIWDAYMRKYDFGPPHDLYDYEDFAVTYRLRKIVTHSKQHWDRLGQPYPDHLQAAIDQLATNRWEI